MFDNLQSRRITDQEISRFDRIYNGVDWGFCPDPRAFNRMHYDAARRTLYIFGELTRYKQGNRATADALLAFGLTGADRITADSRRSRSPCRTYKNYGCAAAAPSRDPAAWTTSRKRLAVAPPHRH